MTIKSDVLNRSGGTNPWWREVVLMQRFVKPHDLGFVTFFFCLLSHQLGAGPAGKDVLAITRLSHGPSCPVAPGRHPMAGDLMVTWEGVKCSDFDDFRVFLSAVSAAAGEKPVLTMSVLRDGHEVLVEHSESDGVEVKSVSTTPATYSLEQSQADLGELFEVMERVYIGSGRVAEAWYPGAKMAALGALAGIARAGDMRRVDIYSVVAAFLARFEDGHLDISQKDLENDLATEHYVEGRRVLALPIVKSQGRYVTQLGAEGSPMVLRDVDGVEIGDLVPRLAAMVSGDTPYSQEEIALRSFSKLHYMNVIRHGELHRNSFRFHVEDPGGVDRTVEVAVELPAQERPATRVGEVSSQAGVPVLTLDGFTLDDDFTGLVDGFFKSVAETKSSAVIIDLRGNGGGSSHALKHVLFLVENKPFTIYEEAHRRAELPRAKEADESKPDDRPLLRRFTESIEVTKITQADYYQPRGNPYEGRICLLIGPRNYSTAVDAIVALKNRGKVTTIGAPTGGRTVSPGDAVTWTGSRTGVKVEIPVGYFFPRSHAKWSTAQGNIAPDISVENAPFSRQDAVMERAVAQARKGVD